jgi:phosphoribosylanthranilate isomerase
LLQEQTGKERCVIAGGINESNVDELLLRYSPSIIDISSGVETEGKKDLEKIKTFMERVREYEQHCL